MTKGVKNWSYRDVQKFLQDNHFYIAKTKGSHIHFVGNINKESRIVTVPFHNKGGIKPKTMQSIIAQSGIKKDKWFEK